MIRTCWLAPLILVTGLSRPAYCQPTFVADGASRASFYGGGVVYGTTQKGDRP